MDIKALMAELAQHGCLLQTREELALAIIKKHIEAAVAPVLMAEKVEDPDATSEER